MPYGLTQCPWTGPGLMLQDQGVLNWGAARGMSCHSSLPAPRWLHKEAYRAFPRFLLFAACAYVLQHPWNTNRDIGISKRQTLIADTGLSSLVHMASTISLHGAHDQQVGVGDRYCAVGTPRQRIADQAAVHDWGGDELHQSFMALHTRCSILGTQTETSASRSVRRSSPHRATVPNPYGIHLIDIK